MKKLLLMTALMPIAVSLTACKRGHKAKPARAAAEALKEKDLQGTWKSECSSEDSQMDSIPGGGIAQTAGEVTGYAKSSRMMYTFAGNNLTRTIVYYVQDKCAQEAVTVNERGEFKIDDKQKTNDGGKNIDFDFRTVTVAVKDGSVVEALNKLTFCGNGDWKADSKEREVTARAKDATCYNAEVPRKIPAVYRIDSGTLYFGSKVAKAGERAATVNFNSKFTK